MHPSLVRECAPLLEAGHHREAVLRGLAVLLEQIRTVGDVKLDGADLMTAAFGSRKQPKVVVADRRTKTGESIQHGIHMLGLGLIAAVRDPAAHELLELNREEALERLAVASLIYRHLDTVEARREPGRSGATARRPPSARSELYCRFALFP
jgi:uncharacterized protein (TIGR02391 family)